MPKQGSSTWTKQVGPLREEEAKVRKVRRMMIDELDPHQKKEREENPNSFTLRNLTCLRNVRPEA